MRCLKATVSPGRLRQLDLALEDREQVVPATRRAVEAIERWMGQLLVVDLEDGLVGLDGLALSLSSRS